MNQEERWAATAGVGGEETSCEDDSFSAGSGKIGLEGLSRTEAMRCFSGTLTNVRNACSGWASALGVLTRAMAPLTNPMVLDEIFLSKERLLLCSNAGVAGAGSCVRLTAISALPRPRGPTICRNSTRPF